MTAECNHADGILTRIEFRRDWSDMKVFDKKETKSDSQNTLLIGMVYTF